MSKVIRSLRDARGNVIQKQPEHGVGQQTCMKCLRMCVSTRMPDGTVVMKCTGCGASHMGKPLDGPRDPKPGHVPPRAAGPTRTR